MGEALVSVILPVYNGERYLSFALQSVLEQDYRPFEVIVVDDGSVDDSANIAKSHSEVRYVYQPNQGVGAARNLGISLSRGDFIAFLDQDDMWTSNKLSVQMDYLVNHPHIAHVLAKQRIFLEPGTTMPSWLKKDILNNEEMGALPGTLVARKSIFAQIGNFDPGYTTSSDTDWFFRAKDAGVPMVTLPEVLLHRRVHRNNHSYHTKSSHVELLNIARTSIKRQRQEKHGENRL